MEPTSDWDGCLIGGRYELEKWISKGNMSNVFLAWDNQQNCRVVVKIATTNSVETDMVERLKLEGRALRRLNHPRIVRLLDSGNLGDTSFIVLEYIEGVNLSKYIKENSPLPLHVSVSILTEVLECLGVIHQAGMVYRDLKPSNLMMTSAGIKIIDFGCVRFMSATNRPARALTNPGIVMGTAPFVSPEQAYNKNYLDGRSDIYACGVLLYKLLTNTFPFSRFEEGGMMLEYWEYPLRSFSAALPAFPVPGRVRAVVWKALAVDPNLRYQTATEMRAALLEAVQAPFHAKLQRFFDMVWRTIRR